MLGAVVVEPPSVVVVVESRIVWRTEGEVFFGIEAIVFGDGDVAAFDGLQAFTELGFDREGSAWKFTDADVLTEVERFLGDGDDGSAVGGG